MQHHADNKMDLINNNNIRNSSNNKRSSKNQNSDTSLNSKTIIILIVLGKTTHKRHEDDNDARW